MTVTLPGTWTTINPTATLYSGRDVDGGALSRLAANSHHLYARLTAPLGALLPATPLQPLSVTDVPVCLWPVQASADGHGLLLEVWCDPGTYDATLRLYYSGDGAVQDTATITGGTGKQRVELHIAAGRTVDDTAVFSALSATLGTTLEIYSVALYWARISGTVSDAPRSSGFRFMGTHEYATTRGVHTELLDRLITNPRLVWADRRAAHTYWSDNQPESAIAPRLATLGARAAISRIVLVMRWPGTVRWLGRITGGATWSVELIDDVSGASVEWDQADTPTAYGSYDWYEGTMVLAEGEHVIDLYAESAGVTKTAIVQLTAQTEVA